MELKIGKLFSELVDANNTSTLNTYNLTDEPALDSIVEYSLEIISIDNTDVYYINPIKAHASEFINLVASNEDGSISDNVTFGVNELASDSYDSNL